MTVSRDNILFSNPALLERIDQLRELNIGQHVPLPQLVVVGDQSSGKSSLLESLTGIPFPKDQSLCTRHVTQITSRRSDVDRVDVRIIAGPNASEDHRKYVEGFQSNTNSSSDFRGQFVNILKKANERMGLRADVSTGSGAVFTEDVLKIELHGLHEEYLTIIDVPGIFRTTTEGTTKDDMAMVKDLVKRYIKEDRTIILAVLPSNVDIATQEILELAEEYDKRGERTLGVLTKPDLVTEPGAQEAVCNLIQGNKRPLTLGYFLVRNRGASSGSVAQPELDLMFRQQPWSALPEDRVGIPALKGQLRLLLGEIARREFPKLIRDVNDKIKECKKELDSLGPPRQHEREQRIFLSHMANTFQDRARAALAADYHADPVFDQTELRLITHVVNITDVFSSDSQQDAHSRHFENKTLSLPLKSSADFKREKEPVESVMDSLRALLLEAKVDNVTPGEFVELGDIIALPTKISRPDEGVTGWIDEAYLRSRGQDLGTFNPNFVSTAFAEQSCKWGDMTMIYMSRIILTLHRFIAAALRSVCSDEQARSKLWSAILDSLIERYKAAIDQANLLVEVERRKQPYTLNRRFSESLLEARGSRITELLRPKARTDAKQYGLPQNMVNLDDIAKAAEGKSNVEQLKEEIHDILKAYYGLALDRYIDNVFQLAVDYHLLHGPSSPLKVFTQDWVINLEPELLNQIIGEKEPAKKRRQKILKKIDDLSKASKILKN